MLLKLINWFINYLHNKFLKKIIYFFINKYFLWRGYYVGSDLMTLMNSQFKDEKNFKLAFNKAIEFGKDKDGKLKGIAPTQKWRIYFNQVFFSYSLQLEGDLVDCGTHFGCNAISNLIYNQNKEYVKKYYLIDSYKGLSEKYSEDPLYKIYKNKYKEHDLHSIVKNNFKNWKNVIIINGFIPEILQTVEINKICYLHINLNAVYPEIEAFNFFWNKVVKGGVVILDDILSHGHHIKHYEIFENEILKKYKIEMINMPTGQGLIIKN